LCERLGKPGFLAIFSARRTISVSSSRMKTRLCANAREHLRDAKLAVRKRPEWTDPFHWAPFVLMGTR